MRLGLLGPCPSRESEPLIERAADFLLNEQKVSRAIYLGGDDRLEDVVGAWAKRLVGDDPTDDGVWGRAAAIATAASADELDALVTAERMRKRLRSLESLPHRVLRTMEMVGDRIAVLIFDKAQLDEEDIFAASILVYGRSDAPLLKKIGARWFLTPGQLSEQSGIGILDDSGDEIVATLYDLSGKVIAHEQLLLPRVQKMKVQGGA